MSKTITLTIERELCPICGTEMDTMVSTDGIVNGNHCLRCDYTTRYNFCSDAVKDMFVYNGVRYEVYDSANCTFFYRGEEEITNDEYSDAFDLAKEEYGNPVIRCKCCGKKPNEIDEYVHAASEAISTPDRIVIEEEGTYNKSTGLFYCTDCYVKLGCPSGIA